LVGKPAELETVTREHVHQALGCAEGSWDRLRRADSSDTGSGDLQMLCRPSAHGASAPIRRAAVADAPAPRQKGAILASAWRAVVAEPLADGRGSREPARRGAMGSDRLAALESAAAVFLEDFDAQTLDQARWVDHYLPQWTTPERSLARYALTDDGLQLRIDADQLDWRPEDAPLRVSNIQTATFSGPLGSTRGTHRHRSDGLTVRTRHPHTTAVGSTARTGGPDCHGEPRQELHVGRVACRHRAPGPQ
jgi:hypothetical protein